MQLHQFSPTRKKRVQRIGRSGKRGSYSGRGVKGQHSRSGRKLRPAERDLIIRLPKLRGFANKPRSEKPKVFNLDDLERAIKRGDAGKSPIVLNLEFLKQRELLPKGFRGQVKILGDGAIRVPVRVEGLRVSGSAKAKIEKAGGNIVADQRGLDADRRRQESQRKSA